MMNFRTLIALGGLLCCSVFRTEADSAIEPASEVKAPLDARKLAKRSVQVVVRADGRIVERLTTPDLIRSITANGGVAQPAGVPASPEAWLARMLDPTKNGLAAKHPEFFQEWLDAVTEPRFMTALATVAVAPGTYANTLGKMADPGTARNWAEFADPQIYFRWMAAGADPGFYQGVFNRMADGEKWRRWGFSTAAHEKTTAATEVSTGTDKQPDVWLQMPSREAKANPWLMISPNYRY